MALAKDLSDLPTPAPSREDGCPPDPEPRFVHLLAERWASEDDDKPRAFADTRFRHSDAGKCARAIAYAALDLPSSNPMDLSGSWNTGLGTTVHELWQDVLRERYPSALIEPKVRVGDGSGHIDAVVYLVEDEDAGPARAALLDEVDGRVFGLLGVDGGDRRARLRGDRGGVPVEIDLAGSSGVVGAGGGADPGEPALRESGSSGAGDGGGEHPSRGSGGDGVPEGGAPVHAGEHEGADEARRPDESGVPGVRSGAEAPRLRTVAIELKTIGGFAMKLAVGERGAAQGPKHEHIVQASLNALAVDADEAVIAYLSKEAISVDAAKRKGIGELGRFCAEWTYTREQYLPVALAEIARVQGILNLLDEGQLPARKIPDLPAGAVITDPRSGQWRVMEGEQILDAGSFWMCGYCRFRDTCALTPAGRTPIAEVAVVLGQVAA